jgi:prepilin-type N-terminal cleavage/methylation domain-containing protein
MQSGFTLTEILITLGLVAALTSLGLPAEISEYEREMRRTDQALVLSSLREARAESLYNVVSNPDCTSAIPHGVYVTPNGLTIFEGQSYDSRYIPADITFSFSSIESLNSGNSEEIVFEPRSGEVSTEIEFTMTASDGYAQHISIAQSGAITKS